MLDEPQMGLGVETRLDDPSALARFLVGICGWLRGLTRQHTSKLAGLTSMTTATCWGMERGVRRGVGTWQEHVVGNRTGLVCRQ